ncbi:MAG: hypothetical protein PF447_08650 [Spirochaetaceae bacterium]|nr:hypothetical protein [Spirochaetaceae bacterium]
MTHKPYTPVHNFHIPVLGTGFSIDTPLKVAKFGISSVVSLVDDQLIEDLREYHSRQNQLEFTAITQREEDSRARRITEYLNLMDRLITQQMEQMKSAALSQEEDNGRYFEMLPVGELKNRYIQWQNMPAGELRDAEEQNLKQAMIPGSIDVNIMTKLDREATSGEVDDKAYYSDANAALRGYAKSDIQSSVVFSAGMNPRLFASMMNYPDFFADHEGVIKKQIILKVSDYRSAIIQGLMLAKKGLWVSEFRIESGLNCGGHAFATRGHLMGPIMQEFHDRRTELKQALIAAYEKVERTIEHPLEALPIRITAQGGVGTSQESQMLKEYYELDSIGWGTPFMLVPQVINVDKEHLKKLQKATDKNVFLSQASPLGILFWNMKDSASELLRILRIKQGRPGAPCTKGFLAFNQEVSDAPLCTASSQFQRLKIEELKEQNLSPGLFRKLKANILSKACICKDLRGCVADKIEKTTKQYTALTPGPNIVNFSKKSTLKEMVSHIYGKLNLMTNPKRPHLFIRELELYLQYLKEELKNRKLGLNPQRKKYFVEFQSNLLKGVEYYSEISKSLIKEKTKNFQHSLENLKHRIKKLDSQIEAIS